MRSLVAAAMLLVATPAQACFGSDAELALLHSAPPEVLPAEMVVLEVELDPTDERALYGDGMPGLARKVVRGEFTPSYFLLRSWVESSCDRPFANGRKGLLVGIVREREGTIPVIEPYWVARGDGFRIAPGKTVDAEWLRSPHQRITERLERIRPVDPE